MSAVVHVVAFDAKGNGRVVAAPGAAPDAAFLWVHVDAKDEDARPHLLDELKLEESAAEALLAYDTRPRCELFGESASVNLRGINHNPGAEPEDMVSVRIWVTPKKVVSVFYRPVVAVDDVRIAIEQGRARAPTPGALVALIAMHLADHMTPTITELNDQIDEFEEQVVESPAGVSRAELAQLRRTAILLRRYVAPQREALNRLALEVTPWSTEADRRRFREAADMTTRVAEEIDAARERAAIVQDQIADARAQSTNRSMLVLSVATAVFLPLNLVAGMFGMNLGGVPLAGSPFGFWVISAILIALMAVGVAVFKKIGWL